MITTMTTAVTRSGSHPLLTKTFNRTPTGWDKADYDGAFRFHATDFEVNDLTGLADLLTMLASDPYSCIVRGETTGETQDIRRTLYDDDKSVATLRARSNGQAWVMLDFDAVPVSHEGYTTNDDRLAHLIAMLPACFHDVSFYYQWSASAGTAGWDYLSCHLWFWLDQPWLCRTMYERFATGDFASAGVDPSPFTPNQIHYTAAPIFRGAPDPLGGQRYGLVRFTKDAVTLPTWTRPVAPKPTLTALQHNHLFPNKRFIELLGEIGPGYHAEIRKAIAHYCSVTAPNDFDRVYLINSLENAIHLAVPGKSRKSNYLNAGYLNRLVDGAQRKFGRII